MNITHEQSYDPYKKIRDANQLTIDVKIFDEDADSTRTQFYFNGELKGCGIEDEHRDVKVKGETRIDGGTYPLDTRISPKFSHEYFRDDNGELIYYKDRKTDAQKARFHTEHELIWIKETPRHDLCLIHWGNFESSTDGCYCVGSSFYIDPKRGRAIGGSRKKYIEIYPIIWRALHKEHIDVYMNFIR